MKVLYWYNVSPKDNITTLSTPANSIHNYQACIKDINVAPPLKHTDLGIYEVRDAVCVKTTYSQFSTQFKKGTVTEVYSPHSVLINKMPCHIRNLRPCQRSTSSENNSRDKLSEGDSNVALFFSAIPDNSSAEFEDDYDDAKNERGQVVTTREEMGGFHPLLHRSTRQKQLPGLCHLSDQEIREVCRIGKSGWEYANFSHDQLGM